jgi:hypothetical protein
MYLPHKYLLKALVTKIKGLSYKMDNSFPRVEIHSWDTTPEGEKTLVDWACTCIIEVVSNSTDVGESLDMVEAIRGAIDETMTVEHFTLWNVTFEILSQYEEIDENNKKIWRQLQRVRFNVSKI